MGARNITIEDYKRGKNLPTQTLWENRWEGNPHKEEADGVGGGRISECEYAE